MTDNEKNRTECPVTEVRTRLFATKTGLEKAPSYKISHNKMNCFAQ